MAAPQVNEMRRQAELDDVREFGKAGGAKVVPSRGDGEEEPKLTPEQIEENKKLLDLYENNRAYLVPRKTFRDEQFVERPGGHLKWPNKEPGVDEKGLALKPIEQWGGALFQPSPECCCYLCCPFVAWAEVGGFNTLLVDSSGAHLPTCVKQFFFVCTKGCGFYNTLLCIYQGERRAILREKLKNGYYDHSVSCRLCR